MGRLSWRPRRVTANSSHDPRALPQRDFFARLLLDRRPIGRDRDKVAVAAREVIDDVGARVIPNIDAKCKMGLFLHGLRLDSPWPTGIYSACYCVCVPARLGCADGEARSRGGLGQGALAVRQDRIKDLRPQKTIYI